MNGSQISLSPRRAAVPVRGVTAVTPAEADVQLYRVPDAMRMLRMSRSVIYEQLRSGRLRSVHQGRTRLIPAAAIAEYVALLESEAAR